MGTRRSTYWTADDVDRTPTANTPIAAPASDATRTPVGTPASLARAEDEPNHVAGSRETAEENPGAGAAATATRGQVPINRRKAKKAADTERRERHRQAEARIEAERAQRRADNRAARERDAAERAERQRVADAAQERARQEEAGHSRRAAEAETNGERPAPMGNAGAGRDAAWRRAEEDRQADTARLAERERKRLAEAARRAARAERSCRQAERKAERRRMKDEERRAAREAVRARALGADPYTILGVATDATAEEVTRAYRRLARTLHPDLHQEGTPKERAAREAAMKRVNVAYGLLGDPQRRKAYDRLRGIARG